jgi:hypothetical protein
MKLKVLRHDYEIYRHEYYEEPEVTDDLQE